MASELGATRDPNDPKKITLPPERVQEILEVNRTLDVITEKIVEVISNTLRSLPSHTVKMSLMRKIEMAVDHIIIDLKKEGD